MALTPAEERTAHLLFGEELALGEVDASAVAASAAVERAVRETPVPSGFSRGLQRVQVKRGALDPVRDSVAPAVAARTALLGERAAGPPRFLVRVDEFPHYLAWDEPQRYGTDAFRRFHVILRDAGVPYLLAVTPRVPRRPLDPEESAWRPHDGSERDVLAELAADPGVTFGVHGLDHRTRSATPRRHGELLGLKRDELRDRLDAADAVLSAADLPADVLVPPYNRFDARQWAQLAARYAVVTGGPESIALMGYQRTPQWRGDAVWLPAYHPLYGHAREVRPAAERLLAERAALWIPVVLHWGWERDDGWAELERLAATLAGVARGWDEFLAGAAASRAGLAA